MTTCLVLICVYIYSPYLFQDLSKDTIPEMKESGLESVILRIKSINLASPKEMLSLALDPPAFSLIERAVVNLKEVWFCI